MAGAKSSIAWAWVGRTGTGLALLRCILCHTASHCTFSPLPHIYPLLSPLSPSTSFLFHAHFPVVKQTGFCAQAPLTHALHLCTSLLTHGLSYHMAAMKTMAQNKHEQAKAHCTVFIHTLPSAFCALFGIICCLALTHSTSPLSSLLSSLFEKAPCHRHCTSPHCITWRGGSRKAWHQHETAGMSDRGAMMIEDRQTGNMVAGMKWHIK